MGSKSVQNWPKIYPNWSKIHSRGSLGQVWGSSWPQELIGTHLEPVCVDFGPILAPIWGVKIEQKLTKNHIKKMMIFLLIFWSIFDRFWRHLEPPKSIKNGPKICSKISSYFWSFFHRFLIDFWLIFWHFGGAEMNTLLMDFETILYWFCVVFVREFVKHQLEIYMIMHRKPRTWTSKNIDFVLVFTVHSCPRSYCCWHALCQKSMKKTVINRCSNVLMQDVLCQKNVRTTYIIRCKHVSKKWLISS